MVYTVTLNPAIDYVMRLEHIDTKDINRAACTQIFYGGKGINVSVILKNLEVPTIATGFAAGFTGNEINRMLIADSIKTDFVWLNSGANRINVKIFYDKQIDINAPGPDIGQKDISALFDKLKRLAQNDTLVLAGSVPSSVAPDIYVQIMKQLQKNNVRFVVDTTGQLLLNALPYRPFLVKPNHHELSEIFNVSIDPKDDDNIVNYAQKLQAAGAKNVLVSRGRHGATLIDENGGIHTAGIVPGEPVNNVGCGDSMVAGFIAGYELKKDYSYALKLGSAAGNATAFCEGLADKKDIEKIYNDYFKEVTT